MPGCCTPFEHAADEQFNRKKAAAELKRYRDRGPGVTTRLLEDGIARTRDVGGTLLDIGSGIGSLAFELLNRGIVRAIGVDASSACVETAREEAQRLGRTGDVTFIHADFVSVASELQSASIVTLDRVVCCYPAYEPLLNAAVQHADRCFALSYPRDTWYVRTAMFLENVLRWLTRNSFRTFVHPATNIEQLIRRAGFTLASRRETWTWAVDVYSR
jgi:2-polyprenyl-3-methyl-5-hydroxy-6-metoxy-1,4-benzoquinol methylase